MGYSLVAQDQRYTRRLMNRIEKTERSEEVAGGVWMSSGSLMRY